MNSGVDGVVVALDLADHRNCVGCTWPGVVEPGGLDGFGRTLPAEELTGLRELLWPDPVDFGHGAPDSVSCEGQLVDLPYAMDVRAWSIVGACDGGSMRDTFGLMERAADATTPVVIGLTDFLGVRPAFADTQALACSHLHVDGRDVTEVQPRLWRAAGWLPRSTAADRLVLPVNPGMHVFAIQLVGVAVGRERWS